MQLSFDWHELAVLLAETTEPPFLLLQSYSLAIFSLQILFSFSKETEMDSEQLHTTLKNILTLIKV